MKLVYHSLGSVDTGYGDGRQTGYPEALRRHLDDVSRAETEVELWGTTHGGIADSYRYFAGLDTGDVLENMMALRSADVDGLVIGNVFDPGLREGRELLEIPVTGQLETSVLTASYVADRFGIVSINDKQAHHSRDKLRTYELTDRVELEGMDVDISTISEGFSDRESRAEVLDAFEATAADLVDGGAEVIIPGGGILAMLLVEFDVEECLGVPVMDQIAVQVKTTETLVDLYEFGAIETSEVGAFRGLDDERLDELEAEYGL